MVCKRKGVGLAACPPRKQPRCAASSAAVAGTAGAAATGAESSSPPPPEASPAAPGCPAGAPPEQHVCPLPCASESRGARGGSPKDPAAENGEEKGLSPEGSPSQLPEFGGKEKHEPREPDCEEPPENPGDCCREPPPPSPDINQLPPSILLKVPPLPLAVDELCFSCSSSHNRTSRLKEEDTVLCRRCAGRLLCAKVIEGLLERIASRSQNITEINISDCCNVSDTGVCVLPSKCPGLLRYMAYRCKQLSDTSVIAEASQCPQLQEGHVGNQDGLTDEGHK